MVIKISDLLLEAALVEHSNAVAFAGVRVQVDRSWRRALYSVVDEDDKLFPYRVIYVDLQSSAVAYRGDRKSTRLNSSHVAISYAVFCLKKKKQRASDRSASDMASPST